jgi:hypothetical protein
MGAMGMIGGMLGAAVGTLVSALGKAFGDVLTSTKQIIDDLIGAALRFSRTMADMAVQTGMSGRAIAGLHNVMGAMGVDANTVQKAFGDWGSHLEFLVPRLGILGVNLQTTRQGTVDWAGALVQLRQRWQELPELMRLPYLRGALGQQKADALLPVMQMPEDQFNQSVAQAERHEEHSAVGERVFGKYRWVLDRLKDMVEKSKITLAAAFLPFVEMIADKLEKSLPAILDKAVELAQRLPSLLVGGWNMLLDMLIQIVQMMPEVAAGFMQVMDTARDMLNVLMKVAEVFSKLVGEPIKFPRIGALPWERGGEEAKDPADVLGQVRDRYGRRPGGGMSDAENADLAAQEQERRRRPTQPTLGVALRRNVFADQSALGPGGWRNFDAVEGDGEAGAESGAEGVDEPDEQSEGRGSSIIRAGVPIAVGLGISKILQALSPLKGLGKSLLSGIGRLLAGVLPRVIGPAAAATVTSGPIGWILGLIAAIVGIMVLRDKVNVGADTLREDMGIAPLDPDRRKQWEKEREPETETGARNQREQAVSDRWQKGADDFTKRLEGMRHSFDWLSSSAPGKAGHGDAAQKHEVTLKLPKPLYSEVGALEVADNLRLIFQATVS